MLLSERGLSPEKLSVNVGWDLFLKIFRIKEKIEKVQIPTILILKNLNSIYLTEEVIGKHGSYIKIFKHFFHVKVNAVYFFRK